MSCDIHAFAEVKIDAEDQWMYFSKIDIPRNYELFSKMAPVVGRGNQKALAAEKGLPDDATKLTLKILERSAEHTFSWLSKQELALLLSWLNTTYAQQADWLREFNELRTFISDIYEEGFYDKRLIFGFDN